jgi:hypothetical protein
MELSWTPIVYTSNHGGYRVFYSNTADGPYTIYEETADKTTSSIYVDSLPPGFTYYFYIQTITYRHGFNLNDVVSQESSVVAINLCEGDFGHDGSVDNTDLAIFANDYGRTDCSGDCEGDFDNAGHVDGGDLAVFVADFLRTDCP